MGRTKFVLAGEFLHLQRTSQSKLTPEMIGMFKTKKKIPKQMNKPKPGCLDCVSKLRRGNHLIRDAFQGTIENHRDLLKKWQI